MPDSQALFDFWAALRADGWDTTLRVLVSDSGDAWVVEAAKGGRAVQGRAASPEAAWEAAHQAQGPAAGSGDHSASPPEAAGVGDTKRPGRPRAPLPPSQAPRPRR